MKRQLQALLLASFVAFAIARPALASPDPPEQVARNCIDLLQRRDPASFAACSPPGKQTENMQLVVLDAQKALQLGPQYTAEVVNHGYVHTTTQGRTDNFVFHVHGLKDALLVAVQTRDLDGRPSVTDLRWQTAPVDLHTRFPFTLSGIDFLRIVVLAMALALVCLVVFCAIHCWRNQRTRRWVWLLLMPVGVGKWSFIWLPAPFAVETTQVSVQLLCVGASKMPIYEPWVVTLSFPVIAVLYLSRVFQRIRTERQRTSQTIQLPYSTP